MAATRIAPHPWWSAPGPEYCESCRHAFRIEIGFHCPRCDRPVCPLCAVTVQGEERSVCGDCSAESGG